MSETNKGPNATSVNEKPKPYSRREILKTFGLGGLFVISAGGVGLLVEALNQSVSNYNETNITPSPSPSPNYRATNDNVLSSTATAVRNEGRETSFVPEAGFTQEMVDQIRKGLFVMVFEKDEGKKILIDGATGLLIKNDGQDSIIATAGHATGFLKDKTLSRLRLIQPFSNSSDIVFTLGELQYATYHNSQNPDIGLIRTPFITTATALPYDNNPTLSPGNKILITGYPAEFWGNDRSRMPTSAFVGEISEVHRSSLDKYNGSSWVAKGHTDSGNSGSPVFKLENGNPVMVGVMNSTTDPDKFGGFTSQFQPLLQILKSTS